MSIILISCLAAIKNHVMKYCETVFERLVLLDFSLTVKEATLIFISRRGSAISSAKEGKSGFIYNLVNS